MQKQVFKYPYQDVKNQVKISEERKSKFAPQQPEEREALKRDLISTGFLRSNIVVTGNDIEGFVIVDGMNRWEVLPEVIKENPNFDTAIPFEIIPEEEVNQKMYDIQVGRRNLTPDRLKNLVKRYQEINGVTKKEAIKAVAADTNTSPNKVKTSLYPKVAEQDKAKASEKYKQAKSSIEDRLKEASQIEDKVERRQALSELREAQRTKKTTLPAKKEVVKTVDFHKVDCVQDAIKVQQQLLNRFRQEGLDTTIFSNSIDSLNKLLNNLL